MEDERYEWEGEDVSFEEYMEHWNAAIEADLREDEERYERERETPSPPPESVYATMSRVLREQQRRDEPLSLWLMVRQLRAREHLLDQEWLRGT